ncbi:bifunctional phosphopantothenoylcysteine decarboxylase/phosphopantothenate--cysteine ligase CoaBC [Okibacterium endophyticum]
MTGSLNIVVGITGGIAAYKAVGVIRSFVVSGHRVQVVATESALRFVGRPTLEAISRNPVHTDLYDGVASVRHVAIGQAADLIVIVPATANSIAKLAAGIADDLLGNTVLASRAPLAIAPAMHTEMWTNPATQQNIATLRSRGAAIIGPASGRLTGDDVGEGRMEEPRVIALRALELVEPAPVRDLAGRRVVVTAGGTREPLDPVRFIGNLSTGRQGVALCAAAAARGADVTLVAAHLEVDLPEGVDVRRVSTTAQMRTEALAALEGADVVIMCAAVADYRPRQVQESKIAKESTGDGMTLDLIRNPDILAELAAHSSARQRVVGFAAETVADDDEMLEIARRKLERKGCDALVLNRVGGGEGFGAERNTVIMLSRGGDIVMKASGDKVSVAHRILDSLASL